MAKKIGISVASLVVIALIGFFLILKTHPPLKHTMISYSLKNSSAICIDLENEGFSNIKLKQVLVNDNQKPRKILLGTSRSNGMITIGLVNKPPMGVQFGSINAYPIKTPPKSKYKYMQFNKIRHYGLVVYNQTEIRNIVIKYRYLGLPFKNKIDVSFN